MKKQNSSIDGFIPRRSGTGKVGGGRDIEKKQITDIPKVDIGSIYFGDKKEQPAISNNRPKIGFDKTEIDASLNSIDEKSKKPKKLSRKQKRLEKKRAKKPRSLARRIIKWAVIFIIVAVLGVGGYLAYKIYGASGQVFSGSILSLLESEPLKQDENGRSNFLVLGTSEDDPGHEGATLTDSILVISLDQTNKNAYIFSVPRDLYVNYGMACNSGYSGKINEYFMCVNDGTTDADEQDRLSKTQAFIGDIFGLDIQYGLHVNHTVLKEAVDAVGGIDVDVEGSNGDPGVFDRNFDWRCDYTCYYVKYDNGVHHLDGEHALFLAMARGDMAPTYGLGNSNFDREKNQQKIIIALKDKALSSGTLTNLSAITGLIDAFGSNLRTNIQTNEIRTLTNLASEIDSSNIKTLSLIDTDNSVVSTGNYNGMSVVMPSAGMFEYDEIQDYIARNLSSNPVVSEAAPIVVLNGSGEAGYGQSKADDLTAAEYNVVLVDNAPDGTYEPVEIYQIGDESDGTAKALAKLYNVTIKTTTPPIAVDDTVQFVIIFGSVSEETNN